MADVLVFLKADVVRLGIALFCSIYFPLALGRDHFLFHPGHNHNIVSYAGQ